MCCSYSDINWVPLDLFVLPFDDIVLLCHAKAWETGPVSFGGLRSLARIFSPSLAETESSEFARLLLYLPKHGHLKHFKGAPSPLPRTPMCKRNQNRATFNYV